jgi:tRNA pseudouridine55 synthase
VYLLHKPAGPSSKAVLDAVRGAGGPPLAHGGALDPFASGLLLALAGEATKLFPFLHGIPKVYEVEVAWGRETDTGDPGGRVVAEGPVRALSPTGLADALAAFVGWHDQVPPATSNKRVDGERAWVLAHRGEAVAVPPSRVYLHDARWTGHALPGHSRLTLVVAGGFYVRSLVRDLGRRVGVPAHVAALHRRAIGPWVDPGAAAAPRRLQGEGLLPWCASRRLTAAERPALRAGGPLPRGALRPPPGPLPAGFPPPPVRLVADGRLLALADDADPLVLRARFGRGL